LTLSQYLELLEREAVTLAEAQKHGRIVYELSLRRELILLGEEIANAAYDSRPDIASRDQIEHARNQLKNLSENGGYDKDEPLLPFESQEVHGLHQFSTALLGAIESAAQAFIRAGSGLKTGLQPSELIVLASRPGMGKTALATNIAYNVAKSWRAEAPKNGDKLNVEGGIVGFFSLEMSSEQIATRVISQQSGVPINVIRRGAISEKQFEIIRDKAVEFQALPFFIDETTTLSIEQLAARANRLKSQKGLDLLIIDNLELLRTAARTNFGETRLAALQITRELKKLAKELAIPILVLAQLPSKVERRQDRRPCVEEFNDRGAIEQDADVIIFLHRDDFYLSKEEPTFGTYEYENWVSRMEKVYGLAELIIAKQRNGATGSVELFFNPGIGSFDDAAT
jgi:replicative DNA helicase